MTTICQPTDPFSEPTSSPVRAMLRDFSIEATPKQVEKTSNLGGLLPAGTAVYVPFLAGTQYRDTIEAARRLAAEGMLPVPHLAARAVPSQAHLEDWLAGLADVGVDSLLLIAGDVARPAGPFADTMQLLDTGLLKRHGFNRVGIAGHPEGHPVADDAALTAALAYKQDYARATDTRMWVVSQFVFEAPPVVNWLDRLGNAGIDMPVRVGLPGPATLRTLIAFALSCGVASSARALVKRPEMAGKLLGQWHPDAVLAALAYQLTERLDDIFSGIHVFPFGGLAQSIAWFGGVRDGTILLPGDSATLPEASAPA